MIQMTFYHSTTEENWGKIKAEGLLWGERGTPSRCTYLAIEKEHTLAHGDVLLQVDYDPSVNAQRNNYIEGCWQLRVYEPIPLSSVWRITL